MHVCTYVNMDVCMCVLRRYDGFMYICVWVYMYVFVYVCIFVCMYVFMYG